MERLRLEAPAKLNLFLKVKNKRRDGYHNIETIFEKVDLCDRINLARREAGISLKLDRRDLPHNEKNLAYRAARQLMSCSGRKFGLAITIKKNIPVAAGLGGGSSDAAAVLVGANRLCRLGLKRKKLLGLAAGIGADTPFFVSQYKRALGSGRGDRLRALNNKKKYCYLLVSPGFKVSTPVIYKAFKTSGVKENHCPERLIRDLNRGRISSINNGLYNDLQATVLKRYRKLRKIIGALKNCGATNPLITGSGPAVFSLAKHPKEAKKIKRRLLARMPDLDIRLVKSYNR